MPTTTFSTTLKFPGRFPTILRVRFSPGGTCLAAACGSRVHVWDARSGEFVSVYEQHESGAEIRDLAWSSGGTCLASLDDVQEVHIWQRDGQHLRLAHCQPWAATLFWPAAASEPIVRGIKLGAVGTHPDLTTPTHQAWGPDGQLVAAAHEDTILIFDPIAQKVRQLYTGHRQFRVNTLEPWQAFEEGQAVSGRVEEYGYEISSPIQVRAVARAWHRGLIASADNTGQVH